MTPMGPKSINRNDIIRDIMYILSKHSVDLQKCLYNCSTDIATLFGELKKSPRGDFTTNGVVSLCRELKSHPHLRDVMFRFDNWQIDSNLTSVLFMGKREVEEDEDEAETKPELEETFHNSCEDEETGTFRVTKNDLLDGITKPDDDAFL